jgi:cellulose 1,4-beta-cellobiosidase
MPSGCQNNTDCTTTCAIEGADYARTYGITTPDETALRLQYVTSADFAQNFESRSFLLKADVDEYEVFTLAPDREISFDVDVSNLPCGLSGSLYFVAMDGDGGMGRWSTNKAGAKYGTGYCDASCPQNVRFINGEVCCLRKMERSWLRWLHFTDHCTQANADRWIPPVDWRDQDGGRGYYGSCCAEVDIWDSNSMSTALTAKPCTTIEQTRCEHDGCGPTFSQDQYQGVCDPDGCDFNPYRMGDRDFYGKGKVVDTSKPFTVVTQFIGGGEDLEIKRFYVQNGTVIENPESKVAGVRGNSLTSTFCDAQKDAFSDENDFKRKGGMAQVSKALERGMVMVFRIWDDNYAHHLCESTFLYSPTAKMY